jgi:tRNA-modifying protein YgfZ
MTNMALNSDQFKQYTALTTGAGVAELSGRTIIAVRGPDRTMLLHNFCTNDVKRLKPGEGCEAFVTSPQGKTLAHVLIFCETDQLVLDTSPGQAAALIQHFERYVITEEVEFSDRTADLRDILVAGIEAAQLLEIVCGQAPPTALLGHRSALIADCPVTVSRVEFAGPASYFVQAAAVNTQAVSAALLQSGGVLCEAAAVEAARLEAGIPLFGTDITPDNLPQEVGRDAHAISFTKGCYLGQETVARIDAIGHVNRLLVGLKFSGETIPPPLTPILAGDQPVGHITTVAWSPKLNAPLALGYLRRNFIKDSEKLTSAFGSVEVVTLPLLASG